MNAPWYWIALHLHRRQVVQCLVATVTALLCLTLPPLNQVMQVIDGVGRSQVSSHQSSWYHWRDQVWILKGRNDELYRGMWVRAMDEMLDRLTRLRRDIDQLQYVGDIQGWV